MISRLCLHCFLFVQGEPVAVNSDVEGSMDEGSPFSPFSDTMEENGIISNLDILYNHLRYIMV